MNNWSETEKQACLAHELSHLQRYDHVSRIVLDVARWILWFHPLAWLLSRQTELAQEMAADQLTVITTRYVSTRSADLRRRWAFLFLRT